jgi:hypothetical protein
MANCAFCFPDRLLSATLSSGSWGSTLNNLKDKALYKRARSTNTSATNTKFNVDFGQDRIIRLIALCGHNMTVDAAVKISFYSDAGHSNLLYTSGWLDVYPSFWPHGVLEWEDPAFWGGEIASEDATHFHPDFWHFTTSIVTARYAMVELSDASNAAGYVELGRCIMAPSWQASVNLSYGASVQWESNTVVDRSLGGIDYFDRRDGRRLVSGTLEAMDSAEGMVMWETQRRLDIHGEMYFVFDPADTYLLHKLRSMLCRHQELNPIEMPYVDNMSNAFQLTEIL